MGKFITKFETEAAFDNAKNNLERPHVSLTADDGVVHYLGDSYNGHAYVEIGGLKWATMNVGATSDTDYGFYFQWGDTQGYAADQVSSGKFDWRHYKFNPSGDSETFTKYNETDHKTVLDLEDDAARANWGGQWRMPTTAEIQALENAVTTEWTTKNGVNGIICTDKTDSSKTLFFPAAGHAYSSSIKLVGVEGRVWSSSLAALTGVVDGAWILLFQSEGTGWNGEYITREYGLSVRGVVG